jgi:3-oxoacyl-[acyl-carrier protein] reductase
MNKKIVLVTGASRGIGRAIAKLLAENDYQVIANYCNSLEAAESLQKELKEKNIEIDIFKADVSKRNEVKNLINFVLNKYGKIDVLINNAGIDQEKLFQDISDEDWNNIMNINLYSVFCTTQEVVKNMIQNKSGCIINISSIYGVTGGACAVAYSATKAGIDGITKSLAKELGPSNIRVNSIAPGCINTDMNKLLTQDDWNLIKSETPMQKVGVGIDIARCVLWLVQDKFTTGQIIAIDGGWTIK